MAVTTKFSIVARGLASAAGQSVKPPVQVFGIEGRYASALYSAATRLNELDKVEKDLMGIQDALTKSPKLRETIVSPIINRKAMGVALQESAKQLNLAKATTNLLDALAENGRMKKLNVIINSFKTIMAGHRGDVVCKVTTAKPLDASQKRELESALQKFIKPNQHIHLTSTVDASLIGGMIVSIGDKFIDMSTASKIKMYTDLIKQPA